MYDICERSSFSRFVVDMSLVPTQRSTTFWLSLAPWTGEQLRQLQQRSKSEPLVRRCAVWCSSRGQLEALVVLKDKKTRFDVNDLVMEACWTPISFDRAQWRAIAATKGTWVHDPPSKQGRRTPSLAARQPATSQLGSMRHGAHRILE